MGNIKVEMGHKTSEARIDNHDIFEQRLNFVLTDKIIFCYFCMVPGRDSLVR